MLRFTSFRVLLIAAVITVLVQNSVQKSVNDGKWPADHKNQINGGEAYDYQTVQMGKNSLQGCRPLLATVSLIERW